MQEQGRCHGVLRNSKVGADAGLESCQSRGIAYSCHCCGSTKTPDTPYASLRFLDCDDVADSGEFVHKNILYSCIFSSAPQLYFTCH